MNKITLELESVQDKRKIVKRVLNRDMGERTYAQVWQELERRGQTGEFRAVDHASACQHYTTAAMVRMEQENPSAILGQIRETNPPLVGRPAATVANNDNNEWILAKIGTLASGGFRHVLRFARLVFYIRPCLGSRMDCGFIRPHGLPKPGVRLREAQMTDCPRATRPRRTVNME